jgi:hypothetical protein
MRSVKAIAIMSIFCLGAGKASAENAPSSTKTDSKTAEPPCRTVLVCPKPAQPKPKKKAAAIKTPSPPLKCECPPGAVGPQGPQGPRGEDGETKLIIVQVPPPAAKEGPSPFTVGIGLMGAAIGAEDNHRYGWGWGPALQLVGRPHRLAEVTLDIGFPLGLDSLDVSPGKQRGILLHSGLTLYPFKKAEWLGLTAGVHAQGIGWKRDGDGFYLSFAPGVAGNFKFKSFDIRTELTALIGGATFGREEWNTIGGAAGSIWIRPHWSKFFNRLLGE